MNSEIKKENWTDFFETLSKRRYEWKTRIEILAGEMGDQVLTEGLPLNGITVETKDDTTTIDISVGQNTESHQTHNIKNPTKIAFLGGADYRDVIDRYNILEFRLVYEGSLKGKGVEPIIPKVRCPSITSPGSFASSPCLRVQGYGSDRGTAPGG